MSQRGRDRVGRAVRGTAGLAGRSARTSKDLALEMLARAGRNNISIASAGVAFYIFLAMVPLLAATVLTYGIVASPAQVARDIGQISQVLPDATAGLFAEQLESVVRTSGSKKGVGLIVALAFALFGARNGAGSILTALNIAHGVPEGRSFLRANLMAMAITAGGIFAIIVAVLAIGTLTALIAYLGGTIAVLGSLLSYALLGGAAIGGAAALYRYAPNRPSPRWRLVLPGALLAAGGWLALTLGFGFYVSNLGNFNATYGSLSAVVALLTWLYFSALVLLLGAELNATWGDRRPGYAGLEVG